MIYRHNCRPLPIIEHSCVCRPIVIVISAAKATARTHYFHLQELFTSSFPAFWNTGALCVIIAAFSSFFRDRGSLCHHLLLFGTRELFTSSLITIHPWSHLVSRTSPPCIGFLLFIFGLKHFHTIEFSTMLKNLNISISSFQLDQVGNQS